MSRLQLDDTIAAIATPSGEGAIGIVRLSGPAARAIAQRLFRPLRRSGRRWQSHRLYHGHVVDPATGAPIDEVLLSYMRAPRSYTGQDVVEISGHGGTVGVREVLRAAVAAGARPAARGEMTLRAFLAGKLDLAQAEAVADAVQARTPAALSLAVGQLGGALSRDVSRARQDVMAVYAHLEATIDFAEDDVPPPPPAEMLAHLDTAAQRLDALLATARTGALYREGARVVLAGRPNAGKSSLLNALLQADRAIVTPVAGTTRDVIEETVDLDGVPAVLADTAGITETADPVERIGVERTQAALRRADVVVLVVDGSEPPAPGEDLVGSAAAGAAGSRLVVALSKADLPQRRVVEELAVSAPGADVVRVSSVTGEGLPALRRALRQAALRQAPDVGARQSEAVITSARHRDALERARAHVRDAVASIRQGMAADFVCIDLRGCLAALGEVTGETVTDDLLTTIFSRFCIGK